MGFLDLATDIVRLDEKLGSPVDLGMTVIFCLVDIEV